MKTLADRLNYALSLKNGATQADLCRLCKVKSSSVSFWFSGKTKAIKGDMLFRVADFLNVLPRWLASGVGPMRGSVESPALLAQEPSQDFSINWPFATVSSDEWKSIPAATKKIIEQQIKTLVPTHTREKIRA
jgi:transcriptional regulator with XRE-family HTH domain